MYFEFVKLPVERMMELLKQIEDSDKENLQLYQAVGVFRQWIISGQNQGSPAQNEEKQSE